MLNRDQKELVEGVRAFASEYYENRQGWDILVECWSDEDIIETYGKAKTVNGAIVKCHKALRPLSDYRDEIQATAF